MRALVLGHALDPTANAVTLALRERHGAGSVHRSTVPALQRARWEHRLSAGGATTTVIDTGDGRNLADVDVVLNRTEPASALAFAGWSDTDCAYGRSEWTALLLAWLASYGDRAINRPQSGTLTGPSDRAWTWLSRASKAGLSPHPAGATTSTRRFPPPGGALPHGLLLPEDPAAPSRPALVRRTGYAVAGSRVVDVIVIGDLVFGDGEPAHDACRSLAVHAGTPVLAVRLASAVSSGGANTETDAHASECSPHGWRFVAANPSPVIDGGAPLLALVKLLEQRAAARPRLLPCHEVSVA